MLTVVQLSRTPQVFPPIAIVQVDDAVEMSPDATLVVTTEDTGPPFPWHVSVYVVLAVKAFVTLESDGAVPTETLLYCPPFKVHAVALAIPLQASVVF
jgi:hypothetical protein